MEPTQVIKGETALLYTSVPTQTSKCCQIEHGKSPANVIRQPQAYGKARNNIASTLYFDKQHNLWLALGDEVLKIDEQGLATHFSIETGLLVNRQYSFFQDSEGTMWFVNQQTGISKLTNQQFEYYGEIKPGFKASDLYADVNSDSVWFFDAVNKKLLVQSPTTTKEISIQSPPHWVFTNIPTQKSSFLTGFFEIYRYDPVKEKPVPRARHLHICNASV